MPYHPHFVILLMALFFTSACGAQIDMAQRQFVQMASNGGESNNKESNNGESDEKESDGKEQGNSGDKENGKPDDIVNPESGGNIGNSGNNVVDTSEGGDNNKGENGGSGSGSVGNTDGDGDNSNNSQTSLPLVQRQTIVLKDGRTITINNADIIHDSERLQIRKTSDLTYTGLHPSAEQMAQAGLLRDEKNNLVFPVVILNHGKKTSEIPEGGFWHGEYYGQFQGKESSHDIYGYTEAQVNLAQDTITGKVEYLTTTPSLTAIPPTPTGGFLSFIGKIKDGEWIGTAKSHDFINPETGQAFTETSGVTEGVFITSDKNAASEAAGHITLKDDNQRGLVGVMNIIHAQ